MSGRASGCGAGDAANEIENTNFVDTSRYVKKHNEIVDYVMHQTNLDLNKYRDGNGTKPNMTSYWDKNGPKVAIDLKRMSHIDKTKLMSITHGKHKLKVEEGGAWIGYVSFKGKQ